MNKYQKIRIRIILFGIVLSALIIVSALYATQIVRGADYATRANRQYVKPENSSYNRGNIYFSSKDGTKVTAATLENGYLAFMNPKVLSNPSDAYNAISQIYPVDKDLFMKSSAKKDDPYEQFADHINTDKAQSIAGLRIKGVGIASESWRSYPGKSLAAHVLGIVGENASSSIVEGKYGLERYYNDILSRHSSDEGNVFAQLFSNIKGSVFGKDESGDIVTTIEPTVEAYLEKTLLETDKIWHADEIGGIVMDPSTGEIVAMVSLPTFDPNDVSKVSNIKVLSDPLVENVYEMGSIVKPLTMAMGLDSGTVNVDSTYDDTGCLILDKKKICNFDGRARGKTDMQTILSQSLNVGAATIALKAGSTTLAEYFGKYGLGERSGIDLPNESIGLVGNLKSGKDIDVATAAYGQGIAVSPIAITRALSILANHGYMVKPHIVKSIILEDGSTKNVEVERTGPILKKETTDEVVNMLVNVVDKAFKKGSIAMTNYSIAAKTGTAQIPDHVNGGYYKDRYLHSFFGFFPAYNPRYIVFLYQIYPKGAMYASETLTQPFDNMAKFLINYYSIPPDR
ncbi:MAG: penicillin-binding protein 2 [Patescibacteria group bacterium]|nr:penicillin-binding protein 2 [Patescibacteria group bacterium]